MDLTARCRPIELLLSDVDGVLTDGGVIFDNRGIEIKRFHIRDGLGIKLWQVAQGHQFGLVTGRASHIVQLRAVELGVELVRQGVDDKLAAVKQIVAERQSEAGTDRLHRGRFARFAGAALRRICRGSAEMVARICTARPTM